MPSHINLITSVILSLRLYFQRILFPFFLILLSSNISNGQEHFIEAIHYGVDEGLFHREVHVLFEDAEGFMWIGTKYGLNRFDGAKFKWYNQSKKGFSFNKISKITQDDEGWLWLWNDADFVFFHPKSEIIQTVEERFGKNIPFKQKLKKEGSWKYWSLPFVPRDQKGKLYLESSQKGEIITYNSDEGFERHKVPGVDSLALRYISSRNKVYFESDNSIVVFDSLFNKVEEIVKKENSALNYFAEIEDRVCRIASEYNATPSDSIIISIQENSIIYPRDEIVFLNAITKDIWICRDKIWSILDMDGKESASLQETSHLSEDIFNHVNTFHTDKRGNIWLATDSGVTLMRKKNNPFTSYFRESEDFPLNSSVRGIWSDGIDIYANLEKGGFCKTDIDGNWTLLDQSLEDEGQQIGKNQTDYWGRALTRDDEGLFWIGGRKHLRSYDPRTKKVNYFFPEGHQGIDFKNEDIIDIWYIHQSKDDVLWLGTGNGLYYKKPENDFISIVSNARDFPEFTESVIQYIFEENDSTLYLCSNQGLYLFNTSTKLIEKRHWSGTDNDKYFLPESDIQHIHKDRDGSYWLSSIIGLIHWKEKQNSYELYNRKNGFLNDNVYAVLEDQNQNLWMGTDNGLVQFNKINETIKTFSKNNGLPHHEFNRTSFFQCEDGRLLFGGMDGLIQFDPKELLGFQTGDHKL